MCSLVRGNFSVSVFPLKIGTLTFQPLTLRVTITYRGHFNAIPWSSGICAP